MSNSLPKHATMHPSPTPVVVPNLARAKAAHVASEQITALRRLKLSLHVGMALTDVLNTIDDTIADIEVAASIQASAA